MRHGKICLEGDQRRYIGQLDLPLSEEGVCQAWNAAKLLTKVELTAIYCSDLARSQQTAAIIAANKGLEVQPLKDLREISLGKWEGRSFAEIARRFPDKFRARGDDIGYYRVPGGESFADCSKRVVAAFHEVMANSFGNILIVGHAGVNRLLLCYILGMPIVNLFRLSQDYGCLNIIQCTDSSYYLKLANFQ